MRSLFAFAVVCAMALPAAADEASREIQGISVTIKTDRAEGSGVIVTREFKTDSGAKVVNFVLTAGHVVADLRNVREVIDSKGVTRKLVEFKDASIISEETEDGQCVGERRLHVKVIKYSDADNGEDLALLLVAKRDFSKKTANFYLDKTIPEPGTDLYHCGSLQGQVGANSMTKGIVSQIGRIYEQKVYDQTTVTAFPGSSGGGVFITNGKTPQYVGMLTRGAGETFNLIVPVRRINAWAAKNHIEWLLDPKAKTPALTELDKLPIEDGTTAESAEKKLIPSVPTPAPHAIRTLERRLDGESTLGPTWPCPRVLR